MLFGECARSAALDQESSPRTSKWRRAALDVGGAPNGAKASGRELRSYHHLGQCRAALAWNNKDRRVVAYALANMSPVRRVEKLWRCRWMRQLRGFEVWNVMIFLFAACKLEHGVLILFLIREADKL